MKNKIGIYIAALLVLMIGASATTLTNYSTTICQRQLATITVDDIKPVEKIEVNQTWEKKYPTSSLCNNNFFKFSIFCNVLKDQTVSISELQPSTLQWVASFKVANSSTVFGASKMLTLVNNTVSFKPEGNYASQVGTYTVEQVRVYNNKQIVTSRYEYLNTTKTNIKQDFTTIGKYTLNVVKC
jgi:hypothetical protein